ncbi:unnamed protein product [Clavelina lepadiformis]|uniref:EGF-like domain-containing protein n=1 Tax=Clavelina lepadiformis TaxID=159417 RepID=A0ABP0GGK5_CLALP
MKYFCLKLTILSICLLKFQTVNSQQNGVFPFVASFELSVDAEKSYTTKLRLTSSVNATFNQSIFENAAMNIYDGLLGSGGFLRLTITSNDTNNLQYVVFYNYSTFASSLGISDDTIASTIGNVTYLSIQFGSDSAFRSLYNLSTSGFEFTGNSLCPLVDQQCGTYASCREDNKGVSISCISKCLENFCVNDGWCIHDDPNQTPVCSCRVGYNWWYVGEHCETLFHIWMLVVYCIVVGLILFLLIPLLTWWCIKRIDGRIAKEKEKKKLKAKKEKQDITTTYTNGNVSAAKPAPPQTENIEPQVENMKQRTGSVSSHSSHDSATNHPASLSTSRASTPSHREAEEDERYQSDGTSSSDSEVERAVAPPVYLQVKKPSAQTREMRNGYLPHPNAQTQQDTRSMTSSETASTSTSGSYGGTGDMVHEQEQQYEQVYNRPLVSTV